jgi:tRNA (guanine-N7-)-methyltransferase
MVHFEVCPMPDTVELIPESYFIPLDLQAAFARNAPLEVDIGAGEGSFLLAMAQRHPERDFLGVERLLGRVRKMCRRAARDHLQNVRVLRLENSYTVRFLLPRESVSTFHILFPDPWPKRRHWPRRLIQPDFLDAIFVALKAGGELRIKTDDAPYFAHIRAVAGTHEHLREEIWPADIDEPSTDFERGFVARGLPIYCLRLVKT